MKLKNIPMCLILGVLISGCASSPIDPLDPTQNAKDASQPQCPPGTEPVYSTEIVISKTDDDRKTGKPRKTYRCEPIK